MTAPVDHEGARFIAVLWAETWATQPSGRLARAYIDLDARLDAACDALAHVLEICGDERMDDRRAYNSVQVIQDIAAAAIDAAHAEGGAS